MLALLVGGTPAARADDSRNLGPTELPQTTVRYELNVRLDPERRTVQGSNRLRWQSPAEEEIVAVPVHLYLNAFSHEGTTWVTGVAAIRDFDLREHAAIHDDPWGWIDINRVVQLGPDGAELPCELIFIQPDDGNPNDRTLGEVQLAKPIAPGEELRLSFDFVARLPITIARTGGREDYFHVAQWFPKIGVYEPGRGWAARQFHGPTEFYSNFADYAVEILLPDDFTVVATGIGGRVITEEAGTGRYRFTQRAVHDFAFVAARNLHIVTHPYRPVGGREIAISYVTPDYATWQIPRMRRAAETTFEVMARRVGPYPFSTMKVIEPPWKARATAGMEYPTLVTGAPGDPLLEQPGLVQMRAIESVVSHEIIHNYFQGLVANDEQQEAFLDEGFTSYWTHEVMAAQSSGRDWNRLFGYPFDNLEMRRRSFARRSDDMDEAMTRKPASLFYPGTVGHQVYTRSLLLFITAARLFGQDAVDEIFATYFRRFRFRHPTSEDFLAIVDEEGKRSEDDADLAGLIREGFTRPRLPDYRVEEATSEEWEPPHGRLPTDDGFVTIDDDNSEEHRHGGVALDPGAAEEDGEVTVRVTDPGWVYGEEEKRGRVERILTKPARIESPTEDFTAEEGTYYRSAARLRGSRWQYLPVTVAFRFADGVVVTQSWDGRAAWRAYAFVRPAPLVEVQIDPEDRIVIDGDRYNNGLRVEPDTRWATEVATWLALATQWIAIGATWWF